MRRIGPRAAYDTPKKIKRIPGISKEDLKRASRALKSDIKFNAFRNYTWFPALNENGL